MKMTFVSEKLKNAGLPDDLTKVDPHKVAELFKPQIDYLVDIGKSMNLPGELLKEIPLPQEDQDREIRELYEALSNPYLAGMLTVFVGDNLLFYSRGSPITFVAEDGKIRFMLHRN